MSISLTPRKSLITAATVVAGALLVVGAGIAPASAANPITHLVIYTNEASFIDGSTHSFIVFGEDASNTIVSDETANSIITSSIALDTVTGNTVTFLSPDTHILKASWVTDPTVTKGSIAVPVVAGEVAGLSISPKSRDVKLGTTLTFHATPIDSSGYPSSKHEVTATYKSSSSRDSVRGSAIRFGSYGARTVTAKYSTVLVSGVHATFTTTVTITVKRVFSTAVLHLVGTFTTGHTLKASVTGISGKHATVHYQWYQSGVAIDGATSSSFKLPSTIKGHTISVHATITAAGYFTRVLGSGAHRILK
ncbi:MAG: hypothetical protein JWR36_2800 [Glaciihabitans sp.]|jgi:hypothetical protein|nr:hypothetical protein [Glaciihabitans sp.]MDQ1570677.1 hypothetical protein [Actinomycetota bacterium]